MTAITIEKAEKYLECFLPNNYRIDRVQRHAELIEAILIDKKVAFNKSDILEIKEATRDITDNLDKSIGLPIGSFSIQEYSDKLINVLYRKITEFIKKTYDPAFLSSLTSIHHDLVNASFCITKSMEPEKITSDDAIKCLVHLITVIARHDPNSLYRHRGWCTYTPDDTYESFTTIMRCVLLNRMQKLHSNPVNPVRVIDRITDITYFLFDKINRGEVTKKALSIFASHIHEAATTFVSYNHHDLFNKVLFFVVPYDRVEENSKDLADELLLEVL